MGPGKITRKKVEAGWYTYAGFNIRRVLFNPDNLRCKIWLVTDMEESVINERVFVYLETALNYVEYKRKATWYACLSIEHNG